MRLDLWSPPIIGAWIIVTIVVEVSSVIPQSSETAIIPSIVSWIPRCIVVFAAMVLAAMVVLRVIVLIKVLPMIIRVAWSIVKAMSMGAPISGGGPCGNYPI